jgi:hypothetical protein
MVGINMANIARRIALGQEHLSALRESHLQKLASQTGLDYVRVDSTPDFVKSLLLKKYARSTPMLSQAGWIPAAVALASLSYCFVLLPLLGRPSRIQASRGPTRPAQ